MPPGSSLLAVDAPIAKADANAFSPRGSATDPLYLGHCDGLGLVVRFLLWGFRHSRR
jgi:hypothetical protein